MLTEIDSTIDVLIRFARRGRGPHHLALILFAHGLPIDAELVLAAIASNLEAMRLLFADLTRTAQAQFPAPTDLSLGLDADFERAEALARLAVAGQSSSVRRLRNSLRSSGHQATNADLLQVVTHLFQTMSGSLDGDPDDGTEVSTNLMRALRMDGLLESAADDVPPLLEHGPSEFIEAATKIGHLVLLPLPEDLTDGELFGVRDSAIRLARALSAVPEPALLHHLGGPTLAEWWDPTDPERIAVVTSLLVHLQRSVGELDASPIVDAIRDQGWMGA